MEPSVFHTGARLRISYDVPHRIFCSKLYPLKAPNGSTIIIYGHEQGIRIIWRGGRSFRHSQTPNEQPKVNGSTKEDAMILDSDEDDPAPDDSPSIHDFELEDERSRSSGTYEQIVRLVDISYGAAVHQLAIPHLPTDTLDSPAGAFPPILLSNIVIAAVCSDTSIRLLTLPLLPPRPSIDGLTYRAVQKVTINGTNSHRVVASGITITHSAVSAHPTSVQERSTSSSRSRNRRREEEGKSSASRWSGGPWCFLIASVSASAGGLLLAHRIPLDSDTRLSLSPKDTCPVQRCYLGSSGLNLRVMFNPSVFPAEKHSTVLVSTTDAGSVTLVQLCSDESSDTNRGRRDSTATTDSASTSLRTSSATTKSRSRFLITLYSGYGSFEESARIPRRKRILDANWVAFGGAVIVLLEDGEWGVWDLDGVGPGSRPANLFQGQTNMSGIQGGAITRFALVGRITTATADVMAKAEKTAPGISRDSNLALMTPHTRKVKGDRLFQHGEESSGAEMARFSSVQGGICVNERAPSKLASLSSPEESIILAHGSNMHYISSLQALWRAETSSKGTFDAVEATRPSPLRDLLSGSDRMVAVVELPPSPWGPSKPPLAATDREIPDTLVVADRRLVFFAWPINESPLVQGTMSQYPSRSGKVPESTLVKLSEKAVPSQGQLDIEAMERMLDSMDQHNGTLNGHHSPPGRNSALNPDEDVDLLDVASPTAHLGARSSRTPEAFSVGR